MKTRARRLTKPRNLNKSTSLPPAKAVTPCSRTSGPCSIVQLHRALGNQAVRRIFETVLLPKGAIKQSATLLHDEVRPSSGAARKAGSALGGRGLARNWATDRQVALRSFSRSPRKTQQAERAVQRLTDADLIKGKFTGQQEYPERVFFNLNDAHVDEFQQRRIEKYFADAGNINQPITLTGLTSEEGDRSYNLNLAARRANEVKSYILKINPKASISLMPARIESGAIDYRFVRAVVINEKVGGGDRRDADRATCNLENLKKLQDKSVDLVNRARANVDNADFEPAIRSLFGDPVPKDPLKAHLRNLHEKLGKILDDGAYDCAAAEDPICSSGALAYANRKTNRISYCPEVPGTPAKDEKEAVNTVIHETLHLTPGLFTKDYAYASDPLISHLPQREALKNTDSYVILIRNLVNSIAPPQTRFEGTTIGFTDGERDQIRESIGWAMSSVNSSQYQVAVLYQAVHLAVTNGAWPDSHIGYVDLYNRLTPVFALRPLRSQERAKGLLPQDKWRLASIHDKLKGLNASVNPGIRKYDITRDDSVAVVDIDFRPMYAIAKVKGAFPSLSLDARVKAILTEAVNEAGLPASYVAAIVEIRDFLGNKWPV
jgi:outer membrane protein OmpA-like peptidoglycan-associated protein